MCGANSDRPAEDHCSVCNVEIDRAQKELTSKTVDVTLPVNGFEFWLLQELCRKLDRERDAVLREVWERGVSELVSEHLGMVKPRINKRKEQ